MDAEFWQALVGDGLRLSGTGLLLFMLYRLAVSATADSHRIRLDSYEEDRKDWDEQRERLRAEIDGLRAEVLAARAETAALHATEQQLLDRVFVLEAAIRRVLVAAQTDAAETALHETEQTILRDALRP